MPAKFSRTGHGEARRQRPGGMVTTFLPRAAASLFWIIWASLQSGTGTLPHHRLVAGMCDYLESAKTLHPGRRKRRKCPVSCFSGFCIGCEKSKLIDRKPSGPETYSSATIRQLPCQAAGASSAAFANPDVVDEDSVPVATRLYHDVVADALLQCHRALRLLEASSLERFLGDFYGADLSIPIGTTPPPENPEACG